MKSSPIHPSIRLAILLSTAALSPLVSGQVFPEVAPEIVSAWKLNGGDALLIFRHDGTYFQVQNDDSRLGMERGTFTWNKSTNAFSATTLRDTNGQGGLSHPAGVTTLSISGDVLTYSGVGEGSSTGTRVVNTANAIVGSWHIPGDSMTMTFLADGTYYSTEEKNDAPYGYDGMECGTYTWNSSSKLLTATPITDTNGDTGLSNLPVGFTAAIFGNAMSVSDGIETTLLRRISPIPSPLNTRNDFEVNQFANYRQTSTSNPSLLPVPVIEDSPFGGAAYIESTVLGTDGTLTIAGQSPRNFMNNDGWEIGVGYTSQPDLNAASAFPNGASYVFSRSGGGVTLSYPVGGTFPSAPKIVGAGKNGSWASGNYQLGQNQTLIWGAHTGNDPATLVTVLTVIDQSSGEKLFDDTVIQGDITSYDFSGKLTPGGTYDVQLEHVKIASSTTGGTGPFAGKLGYALYNSNTRFVMVAPNPPNSAPTITEQPVSDTAGLGADVIISIAASGSPTPVFQWYHNGVAIPGQTGNSIAIFNFTAENYGNYKVTAINSEDTVTSAVATISPPNPFDSFIESYGLDPESSGAPDFDFDKDGIPNLLEYLLGGNPTLPNTNLLPTLTTTAIVGGRNIVFTYKRKLAATGVTQVIEHSTNLAPPWTPAVHGTAGVTIVTTPVPGDTTAGQVTVTIPSTSTSTSRFVRLKASRP